MNPISRRLSCTVLMAAAIGLGAAARCPAAVTSIFQVTSFGGSAVQYPTGFSGTVGVTTGWPSEMGWQGDQIDIAFSLGASVPGDAREYRFRIVIRDKFTQTFDLEVYAGNSLANLQRAHTELIDSARVYVATIPLSSFTPGQTNYIRIKGVGVQVGTGQPSGIRWARWMLTRTDTSYTLSTAQMDQLQRFSDYVVEAVQPTGLVRDSLTLNPNDPPFHPGSPDAGGFALLGLCVADEFGVVFDAEDIVELILNGYLGNNPGCNPLRNTKGHWWHWLRLTDGGDFGWGDAYTTIGSALLVGGALFAKNHFVDNPTIAALADEMYATCDFDAMIHPSLDGRVYLATDANGGALGSLTPWNEYMIIVSLALRQPGQTRATAVSPYWLSTVNLPKRSYQGISTLTDNVSSYAPAFWVHQQHFFNTDFATSASFEQYLLNHKRADELYCVWQLNQAYRYGLTAGVSPSGYTVDKIAAHNNVFSPEAILGWADQGTLLEFIADQPPSGNISRRFGLTRVSSAQPTWIPYDAGLVDHTFGMYGVAEMIDPLFFKRRLPFQVDADLDGIADAYDNCAGVYNPSQADADADGIGDACECGTIWADDNGDGDVDLLDFAKWQRCPSASPLSETCPCLDRDGDEVISPADLAALTDCLNGSGPGVPADPGCGQ